MESYYMESESADESKPGLLKRLVALCRGIINWIRKKIRRLFGKDDSKPVDPKPDLRDLKQLIDESSEEFSNLKDSIGDLEKASNETLADYLKAVEKMTSTVQQYLDEAEKERNIANVQRCKEILEELAKANKNITSQITTNKENESVKEIVENLKKSFERVGTPNDSVKGTRFISIRTLSDDFRTSNKSFPNPNDTKAIGSRADCERGQYGYAFTVYKGYCYIIISAYILDIFKEVGDDSYGQDLGEISDYGKNRLIYGHDRAGRDIWCMFGYIIKASDLGDGIPQIDPKPLYEWVHKCFEETYFIGAHKRDGDKWTSRGNHMAAKEKLNELVSVDNIPVIRKE